MILKGFEIKPITNDEEYFRAEEFVLKLEPDLHFLNKNEQEMLLTLSEYMREYDEKYITPKYVETSQIKTKKFSDYLKTRLSEDEIKMIEIQAEEEFKKLSSNEGLEKLFNIFPESFEKNRIDDDKLIKNHFRKKRKSKKD